MSSNKWALYHNHDPFKCEVVREAIKAKAIADGEVICGDIKELKSEDIMGFRQFHAFCGGGFWSLALRQAGWPDNREAWTGSCLVPPSQSLAKERGLQTLVTSGLSGIASSASVDLERSLVSRLQQRLDTAGSTLFVETWKRRSTPLRRRYWEHTARVRPHPPAAVLLCQLRKLSEIRRGAAVWGMRSGRRRD